MGKFYGRKILEGNMSIDDVPSLWKKMTEQWLSEYKQNTEADEDVGE